MSLDSYPCIFHSAELRKIEEWAQEKAEFLRSPSLRKKNRKKGLRVRFSDIILEYPRTPPDKCSQDFSLPPTIRIEDWSTPSSQVSFSESLTAADTFSRSTFMLSSSRDSFTVPSLDSSGFESKCGTLESSWIDELSCSSREIKPDYEASNRDKMCRSNLPNLPRFLERYFEPDEPNLPRLTRPVCKPKVLLSSSLLDLLQDASLSADKINTIVQEATKETIKQKITIHRDSVQDFLPAFRNFMDVSHRPRGKSDKIASTFKRHHHSYPLSTMSTSLSKNGANSVVPFSSKIGKDKSSGKNGYYRHSTDVVGFPFPMGIVLSSDIQTAILTRFHEKGLATTSEWGFQFQMHPSENFHQQFTPLDSGVPYPCVFDFDDYLQDLSKSPVSAAPAFPDSIPQVSSRSIYRASSTVRIPCLENLSSENTVISAHTPGTTQTHRSYRNMRLFPDGKIERVLPSYERKLLTWSSGTDEEYLTGTECSEDLPLLSYRSRTQGQFDEAVNEPGKPVKPKNSSILNQVTVTKDEPYDVEQIQSSSRSHTLKQRQYDSLHGNFGKDKSPVFLAENYGSGATLWHSAQSYSSHYDRKLDPMIEMNSESECSGGMMTGKAAVLQRFGSDINYIMIADRTSPPVPLYRAGDSSNTVNRGLGSRLGVTRKTIPVFLAPSRDDGKIESVLQTQKKNASTGTSAGKCTKTGMKPVGMRFLSSAPPRPKGRSVVPQRF